jgi:hypothetical protein
VHRRHAAGTKTLVHAVRAEALVAHAVMFTPC